MSHVVVVMTETEPAPCCSSVLGGGFLSLVSIPAFRSSALMDGGGGAYGLSGTLQGISLTGCRLLLLLSCGLPPSCASPSCGCAATRSHVMK